VQAIVKDRQVAPGEEAAPSDASSGAARLSRSFHDLLAEALGQAAARDAGWGESPSLDRAGVWLRARNGRAASREQGWKLHISANAASALDVLRRALPILLEENANFKTAASFEILASLNFGQSGMSQIGKFITIYPNDDEQAVRLAAALHRVTTGLAGPVVPTDRPLKDGSLVHYRYGGFAGRYVQTAIGEIISTIQDPTGAWVPDRRQPFYNPPKWAVDPFLAAGIAEELAEPSPLVGGRYLALSTLERSARSTVYMAVDTANPRRCILKRERRAILSGADNKDAGVRLRHEAEVLRRLMPDPCFPALFDLIEQETGLLLVMEDVEGRTLAHHVKDILAEGTLPTGEQVINWGRALARALASLHGHGLVYRDLKSANIMAAPDGRLRLIDFDIAQPLGAPMLPWGGGTRGYMSPQHAGGAMAGIQDDVYSLGAVLYFAATGAEPASAPHALDLLERPVTLLNPAVNPALGLVIARCLDPDLMHRYTTMTEVDAALTEVGPCADWTPPAIGAEVRPTTTNEALDNERHEHLLGMAQRLSETICRAAQAAPDGTGMAWTSMHNLAYGVQGRDLNFGSAGALLAVAEAVMVFADPEQRVVAAEGARWLRGQAPPASEPLPGLYVGESGIGAALLRVGQVLDDCSLIEAALKRGRLVGSLPYRSPDMFNGTAGRLRFHLMLWDETRAREQLEYAIAAGETLLATAEEALFAPGGIQWRIPDGYDDMSGQAQLGYAHGLAGIADALLDLYETTGEERWAAPARRAVGTLERTAARRGYLPEEVSLDWPTRHGGDYFGPFWCHGAAGIGQFLLHAARLDAAPEAKELALGAARCVARGSRRAGPTQCHGLAGNIEFLLDVFQGTGDSAYLREAYSLAEILKAHAFERVGGLEWPSESPVIFTPDYMVGYAGVLPCLLRLADPERRPRQLSRAGFRFGLPPGRPAKA
jgi:tRNA A-37 threonylcarbamoyl transferase component Bud32